MDGIAHAVKEGKVIAHAGPFDDPWEITPHFLYGMEKFHQSIEVVYLPYLPVISPVFLPEENL
jgi:hypothetical protein